MIFSPHSFRCHTRADAIDIAVSCRRPAYFRRATVFATVTPPRRRAEPPFSGHFQPTDAVLPWLPFIFIAFSVFAILYASQAAMIATAAATHYATPLLADICR